MPVLRALACAAMLVLPALAMGQPPQPPPGFEPLSEVPPGEQIPAFTLLAVAYSFVWIVLIAYVWSVRKRLQQVEQELADLERRRG
jgi:CcmD family protein